MHPPWWGFPFGVPPPEKKVPTQKSNANRRPGHDENQRINDDNTLLFTESQKKRVSVRDRMNPKMSLYSKPPIPFSCHTRVTRVLPPMVWPHEPGGGIAWQKCPLGVCLLTPSPPRRVAVWTKVLPHPAQPLLKRVPSSGLAATSPAASASSYTIAVITVTANLAPNSPPADMELERRGLKRNAPSPPPGEQPALDVEADGPLEMKPSKMAWPKPDASPPARFLQASLGG